jgi:hypothetical protein
MGEYSNPKNIMPVMLPRFSADVLSPGTRYAFDF